MRIARIALALGVLSFANQAVAAAPVIYPANGQTAEQQSKDEGECQAWAKQNTGIDPLAIAGTASQPAPVGAAPPPAESGQRVKGAAKGAAAGAVVGAVAGDAGKGGRSGGRNRGRRIAKAPSRARFPSGRSASAGAGPAAVAVGEGAESARDLQQSLFDLPRRARLHREVTPRRGE
jgi:hypothetical protein